MALYNRITQGVAASLLVMTSFGCERSEFVPLDRQKNNLGGQVTMSDNDDIIKSYELSGGSTVDVLKPFGDSIYTAVVDIRSDYPAVGSLAKNVGRAEHIYVITGEYNFIINDQESVLKKGEAVFVRDGDTYQIKCLSGEGKLLVTVNDKPDGKTEIIPIDNN